MKKQLNNARGETIVEVLVAFVLLLLFTAIFATALRFAQRMNLQADILRENAFQLCGELYPLGGAAPNWQPNTNAGTLTFQHIDFPGMQFEVRDITLEQLPASDEYTFYRYGGFKGAGS